MYVYIIKTDGEYCFIGSFVGTASEDIRDGAPKVH